MTDAQPQTQTPEPNKRGATVSEDSLSYSSDHNNWGNTRFRANSKITNDTAFTLKALYLRNEEERMRVARVMLYDAYQRALRGE